MKTRFSFIFFLLPLLSGCETLLVGPDNEPDCPRPPATEHPGKSTEYWLEKRRELCGLPDIERRARLKFYSDEGEKRQDAQLERLLLASCQPDQTPGLLYEALRDFPPETTETHPQSALIEVIRDFARSYRALETKTRNLEEKLESTIDGIQQIEAEMNGIHSKGEAQ